MTPIDSKKRVMVVCSLPKVAGCFFSSAKRQVQKGSIFSLERLFRGGLGKVDSGSLKLSDPKHSKKQNWRDVN